MPALDLTGERYGRLVPLRPGPKRGKHTRWICRCDCGKETIASTSDLRTGNTTSCGCYMRQRQVEGQWKHGGCSRVAGKDPVYHIWCGMKERCNNPNNHKYSVYGGRGIRVCERWQKSFQAFSDDMGPRPPGYSVERVDNDGPYSPDNCIWASRKTQVFNRRCTIRVEHKGEQMSASEFAARMGVSDKRLYKVMSTKGMSPQEAAAFVKERQGKKGRFNAAQWLAKRRAA